jgi:hypothetical protein
MFGETDFDPSCSYASISIEEQLNALSVAVNAGKVATSSTLKSLLLWFHLSVLFRVTPMHKEAT